jgi:hypothetical protein
MSSVVDQPPPFANPRPGVVKALGILNVVFAVMILISLVSELFWLYAVIRTAPRLTELGSARPANPAGLAMFGMNDPRFLRFLLIDVVTGGVLNVAMLASGIALINLRRWGARLWAWTAWFKLVRLVLLWGFFYIIVVTPSFSENMARSILASMNPGGGRRGALTLGQLTRIYAIMNLIMAVVMIVFGAIYPALTLWMLGRPGVKAALGNEASKEPERT